MATRIHQFLGGVEYVDGVAKAWTKIILCRSTFRVEYVDGVAEAYNHGDGRVVLNDGTRFQFKIADHLGNTVVLFEDKDGDDVINSTATDPAIAEVLQRNLYYPFGLGLEGEWADETAPKMKYLYNGKELNEDFGLDWSDYGARYYDASIGRWNAVDALADDLMQVDKSPYAYAWNNPVLLTDPDGNCPSCVGAGIGAGIDITAQLLTIAFTDKTLDDFSWKSVAVSAVAGATGVGVAQQIKNLGTVGKLGAEVTADMIISSTSQLVTEEKVDLKKSAQDALIGQVARKTLGPFMKNNAANSKQGQQLQVEVNTQKNIARGKSNKFKKTEANISGAQNKLDNFTTGRGAVGSGTAAGSVRKAAGSITLPEGETPQGIIPQDFRINDTEPRDNTIIIQTFNRN